MKEIRVEGAVAYVPLTRGYEAVIDSADVDFISQWTWHVLLVRERPYAQCAGYTSGRKLLLMHRLILGTPVGLFTDHVNGDSLDNRRVNLREATPSQNQCNQGLRKDNTSGYKGVCFDKSKGLWSARIKVNGERVNLGRFKTPEEAYEVYCNAAEKYHREFKNCG